MICDPSSPNYRNFHILTVNFYLKYLSTDLSRSSEVAGLNMFPFASWKGVTLICDSFPVECLLVFRGEGYLVFKLLLFFKVKSKKSDVQTKMSYIAKFILHQASTNILPKAIES